MDYSRPLALVVALALHGSALAQEGTDRCQCLCMTGENEDGNGGRMSSVVQQSAEFSICPIFNDRSCEIKDDSTGQVHFGTTILCEPLGGTGYLDAQISPPIKTPPR